MESLDLLQGVFGAVSREQRARRRVEAETERWREERRRAQDTE